MEGSRRCRYSLGLPHLGYSPQFLASDVGFEGTFSFTAMANQKVLVCDDDRLVLATTAAALSSAGYSVLQANNSDEAIALAREHRPVLAILDIRMEGTTGMDVASYLRDFVGTPFVFISAFSDPLTIRQARAIGALDYLFKPINSTRLIEAIERLLHSLRNTDEAGTADWIEFGQSRQVNHTPEGTMPAKPAICSSTIDIATGMLMVELQTNREAALDALQDMARKQSCGLEACAMGMIQRYAHLDFVP
jgi:two-component system, response regulator PdtaR